LLELLGQFAHDNRRFDDNDLTGLRGDKFGRPAQRRVSPVHGVAARLGGRPTNVERDVSNRFWVIHPDATAEV
jgi:hypothetical protein